MLGNTSPQMPFRMSTINGSDSAKSNSNTKHFTWAKCKHTQEVNKGPFLKKLSIVRTLSWKNSHGHREKTRKCEDGRDTWVQVEGGEWSFKINGTEFQPQSVKSLKVGILGFTTRKSSTKWKNQWPTLFYLRPTHQRIEVAEETSTLRSGKTCLSRQTRSKSVLPLSRNC